jgi:Transposase DDE domain group 1
MQSISSIGPLPEASSGFSVVLVERVLREAQTRGRFADWARLPLGHPSRRRTAYRPEHRVAALLAGLAAGLKGIAPGNTWLRPQAAVQAWLGGRFPDQGTLHRWLEQTTAAQARGCRDHLHRAVGEHGRFWEVLYSEHLVVVDVDGQGLVARGRHGERAARGYLGGGLDTGYQRYVAYAADTHEVLDEFLAPGNKTLMSQLPELLAGLAAVIPPAYRGRVLIRGDAHLGTIGNLRELRGQHYHYVCPLQSWAARRRLREHVRGRRGGWFADTDSAGQVRRVQFWVVRRWKLSGKGRGRRLYTRATVYRDRSRDARHEWTALVTDLKREKGARLWRRYHGRGGAIEEYNDQSERAYHLEVLRTRHFDGLNALHSLIGLCWNLTRWAQEGLRLPPVQAPAAAPAQWVAAGALDLAAVQRRAAHSGLRLYRQRPGATLEVEDTAGTAESAAWCRWLQQPIQLRLRLTG